MEDRAVGTGLINLELDRLLSSIEVDDGIHDIDITVNVHLNRATGVTRDCENTVLKDQVSCEVVCLLIATNTSGLKLKMGALCNDASTVFTWRQKRSSWGRRRIAGNKRLDGSGW